MQLELVTLPDFAGTPYLSYLNIEDDTITLSLGGLDDAPDGPRYLHLQFSPMQGVRITTEDCFLGPQPPPGHTWRSCPMFEVLGSVWVEELKVALQQIDRLATFMEKAHHYVILCRESPVEIVAWGFTWEVVVDTKAWHSTGR